MGKGDPKSKRGKIWRGSYGVRRQKKKITSGSSSNSPRNKFKGNFYSCLF